MASWARDSWASWWTNTDVLVTWTFAVGVIKIFDEFSTSNLWKSTSWFGESWAFEAVISILVFAADASPAWAALVGVVPSAHAFSSAVDLGDIWTSWPFVNAVFFSFTSVSINDTLTLDTFLSILVPFVIANAFGGLDTVDFNAAFLVLSFTGWTDAFTVR